MLLRRLTAPLLVALPASLLAVLPATADHICSEVTIPDEDGLGTKTRRTCEPHEDESSGGGGDGEGGGGVGGQLTCYQDYWPTPPNAWLTWWMSVENRGEGVWGEGFFRCSDLSERSWWVCYAGDCSSEPNETNWIAARDGLIQEAAARVQVPLPGLATSAASPRANGGPMAVVHSETWWWADAWDPVVEEDLNGPLWVRVTATPTALTVDPGDGSDALVCEDGGTVYDYDRWYFDQQGGSDCFHIYTATSADQPDQMVTITATVTWEIRWEAGGVAAAAGSGVLSTPTVTETMRLPVGEIQSVISGYGR